MERRWRGVALAAIAGGAGIGLLARGLLMRVRVEGESMAPALRDGDRVLVAAMAYRFRRPRAGHVVLAQVPAVPGTRTLKRIAAEVPPSSPHDPAPASRAGPNDGRAAPAGHARGAAYILLGDNRAVSVDSRRFGPVMRRQIAGRVWYRYWPPERRGRIGGRVE